jgi:hypothetical protein
MNGWRWRCHPTWRFHQAEPKEKRIQSWDSIRTFRSFRSKSTAEIFLTHDHKGGLLNTSLTGIPLCSTLLHRACPPCLAFFFSFLLVMVCCYREVWSLWFHFLASSAIPNLWMKFLSHHGNILVRATRCIRFMEHVCTPVWDLVYVGPIFVRRSSQKCKERWLLI